MFTQPFVQAQIKENITAPRHWPFLREIHRRIPRTKGQGNAECGLMTSSWTDSLTAYFHSSNDRHLPPGWYWAAVYHFEWWTSFNEQFLIDASSCKFGFHKIEIYWGMSPAMGLILSLCPRALSCKSII